MKLKSLKLLTKSKRITLNYKNVIMATSIFLAVIFLSAVAVQSYNSAVGYIKKKTDNTNQSILQQTTRTMENNLDQIKRVTEYISSDEILIEFINKYKTSSEELRTSLLSDIKSRISIMKQFNRHIFDIMLVTDSVMINTGIDTGMYGLKYENLNQSDYIIKLKNQPTGKAGFFFPGSYESTGDKSNASGIRLGYIQSKYCFVGRIQKDSSEFGCVFVLLKPEAFKELLSQQNVLLVGSDGSIIKGQDNDTNTNINTNKEYLQIFRNRYELFNGSEINKIESANEVIYIKNIDYYHMSVVIIQRNTEFYNSIKKYGYYMFFALLASILLAFMLSEIISNKIVLPLKKLINRVNEFTHSKEFFYKKDQLKDNEKEPEAVDIPAEKTGVSVRKSVPAEKEGLSLRESVTAEKAELSLRESVPAEKEGLPLGESVPAGKAGLSLRESILAYLIGVIIIPISIYLPVTYYISINAIKEIIVASNLQVFKQTLQNVNYYINTKEKVMKNIIFNLTVQDSLNKDKIIKDINGVIDKSLKLDSGRDDIFIYTDEGKVFFSNTDFRANTSLKIKSLEKIKGKRIITTWQDTVRDDYGRTLISLIVKINSLKEFNNIGFLQYQIPEYQLESVYRNTLKGDGSIFIINNKGQIISHQDKNILLSDTGKLLEESYHVDGLSKLKMKSDEEGKITFSGEVAATPWYLVGQYSIDMLDSDVLTIKNEKTYIYLLIFLLTIIVAFLFLFNLTRSLEKINTIIQRLRIINIKLEFPQNSRIAEINELGIAFNEMIERNRKLIEQLLSSAKKQAELENRKKRSEFTALQFQINPHFLYNTFESINWLVKRDKKKDAVKMINSLSQFLRNVSHADMALVTVQEEIEHLKYYIDIISMRFGKKISFFWDIDEEVLPCDTIRMILQPLVENAIYHGIQPSQNEGVIEISCKSSVEDSIIILSVTDNGKGIDGRKLESIRNEINQESASKCIGLHNIQNRIRLHYGNAYGMSIDSRVNIGTIVEIRIPYVTSGKT